MGRAVRRRLRRIKGCGAHAGVLTTSDQRTAAAESLDEFCRRQVSRLRHALRYRVVSYQRRRSNLLSWEHAGLQVESRGLKQPMGAGSYATRDAEDRCDD